MGLFGRTTEPEPVAEDLRAGTPYLGDSRSIVFREGFHYPVSHDSEGNELGPDLEQKLVWRDGGYHYARPDDPNHFHTYGLNAAEIVPAP